MVLEVPPVIKFTLAYWIYGVRLCDVHYHVVHYVHHAAPHLVYEPCRVFLNNFCSHFILCNYFPELFLILRLHALYSVQCLDAPHFVLDAKVPEQ